MTDLREKQYRRDLQFESFGRPNRIDEEREFRRYDRPERWSWLVAERQNNELLVPPLNVVSDRDFNRATWRLLQQTWLGVIVDTVLDWESAHALLDHALTEPAQYPRPELQGAIEESRRILDLEDDWDEEGSVAYSHEVWSSAAEFVLAIDREVEALGKKMVIPRILPGPAGSIDLHWKTATFELLMKVPPDDGSVTFYGDDYGRTQFEGKFAIDDPKYAAIVLLQFARV